MDLKQIKELMGAMGRARIKKIKLKTDTFEVELERESPKCGEHSVVMHTTAMPQTSFSHMPAPLPLQADGARALDSNKEKAEAPKPGIYVTSPMVGTYYKASSSDAAPFVKVGDSVSENSIVCIIEAMKVMNEVKAGVSGTVKEILVVDGQTLEFGANILRVE